MYAIRSYYGCILQLETPTSGEIVFEGVNLEKLDQKAMVAWRQKIRNNFV